MNKNFRDLMAEAKFYESYARYNELADRYETWEEAVDRVMSMHRDYYADFMCPELEELIDFAEKAYKEKKVLGAQRALQFGGEQLLKHHARAYNCTASYADRPEFFGEGFYLMLCGAGIGFSVQHRHIDRLPDIKERTGPADTFEVPDSIEGWAQAVDVLLSSFFVDGVHSEYEGKKVYFDLSNIRPRGAYISGGFKAPGPEPLRRALDNIEHLIKKRIMGGFTRLRPIDVYDIVMYYADAVISGGVRRAATICLFSPDDEEMMRAKLGNWFVDNPQRGRSNNSVVLKRDKVTYREFKSIMDLVKDYGEPGFVFTEDEDIVFNPCVTADTSVMTDKGPRLVQDLIGVPFTAVINGTKYKTTEKGFWCTGTKKVYKLGTDHGYSIKATGNHQILTKERGWVELGKLKIGEEICLNEHNNLSWLDNQDDEEKGWLLGSLVGDGTFANEKNALLCYWGEEMHLMENAKSFLEKHFKTYQEFNPTSTYIDRMRISSSKLAEYAKQFGVIPNNKIPNHSLEEQSSSFYIGYLRGFFDADGSIQGGQKKGVSIRLSQVNLEALEQVQRMLLRLGIVSKIYKNRKPEGKYLLPNGHGGLDYYNCKTVHELIISKINIIKFYNIIGFSTNHKQERLKNIIAAYKRAPNKEKFVTKVTSIELLGEELVYDVTVPGADCFDANGLIAHNCCEISLYPQTKTGESGWSLCVSGDTKLITKTGIEVIKECVNLNKQIEIWNGESWSAVTPIQTGENRNLYRVTLSDGSFLDCTENHKWLIKNRFQKSFREVSTLDLKDIIATEKYVVSTPRFFMDGAEGLTELNAYNYGFVLGDGSIKKDRSQNNIHAKIHENSGKDLIDFKNTVALSESVNNLGTKYTTLKFLGLDQNLTLKLKANKGLPKEVFEWNRESILEFIAGWADADGSQASKGIRIYGEENNIRDCQLLLSKVGICSSVNKMASAGTYVDSINVYRKQDVWYVQITKTIDIPCKRLICNNAEEAKFKGKNQVVKSVEKLSGLHNTYCFEEKELHQAVFNNVLTKQCNLTEINGAKATSAEAFYNQCQAAAILGTLQAGYTNFKFLNEESYRIITDENLLGVSITGWMNSPDILFDKEILKNGAEVVKATNRIVAEILQMNPAARTTTVKPSGNASVLLGTTSGIHGEHAPRYLRNVQFNKETEIAKLFKEVNPCMVENSVWSQNGTDICVSFPVVSNPKSVFKKDLLGIKQLKYVKLAQQYWIEYGTNVALCTKPYLRHNVSNTITVDDWDEVTDYVFDNREYFCGVSFLAASGDKEYPQAPFTEVLTLEQITNKYGPEALFTSGLIEAGLVAFSDNFWLACSTAVGKGLDLTEETHANILRRDFVRRFNKFAKKFKSKEDCINCLKDVYNFHKWWKIQKNAIDINFLETLKAKEFVDIDTLGAQACSGGTCELW